MLRVEADKLRYLELGYSVDGSPDSSDNDVEVRPIQAGGPRGDIGCGLFAKRLLPPGRVLGVYSGMLVQAEAEGKAAPLAGYVQRDENEYSLTKPLEEIEQVGAQHLAYTYAFEEKVGDKQFYIFPFFQHGNARLMSINEQGCRQDDAVASQSSERRRCSQPPAANCKFVRQTKTNCFSTSASACALCF